MKYILTSLLLFAFLGCNNKSKNKVPTVAFLDLLNDATLDQAKKGFFTALKDEGFNPGANSLKIIYRNAQNDQPTLLQACDYLLAQHPDLIATNPTLSTITAIQREKSIPVFMMVSPSPELMNLEGKEKKAPANLFGVYETLDYIDTAFMLIKTSLPEVKKVATIYNQSEPQSVMALERIQSLCNSKGIELIKRGVTGSNESQLAVASMVKENPQAFFALPDNVVFSSMEVIVKTCDEAKIPVFTSEEGLVKRGAVAAFGADMFQWGYQSGIQAAHYLQSHSTSKIKPELVKVRRKVFNPAKATEFSLIFDSTFTSVTQ